MSGYNYAGEFRDFQGTQLDEAIEDLSAVRGDARMDDDDILDSVGIPHTRVPVEE